MFQEIDLAGIYIAPFVMFCAVALVPFMVCRIALARSGVLRRLWHPALFEVALYIIILSLLILLA